MPESPDDPGSEIETPEPKHSEPEVDGGSSGRTPRKPSKRRKRRFLLFLLLMAAATTLYLGSDSFADLVRRRTEASLEDHLDRAVSIERVYISWKDPFYIVVEGVRIANAPHGTAPEVAFVKRVKVPATIESFRKRTIQLGSIVIEEPTLNVEMFAEGSALADNLPRWKASPPRRFSLVHVSEGPIVIHGATVTYLDHRRDLDAIATGVEARLTTQSQPGYRNGTFAASSIDTRLADYERVLFDAHGEFAIQPARLRLGPIALASTGIDATIDGEVHTALNDEWSFRIRSEVEGSRIKEIFEVKPVLDGKIRSVTEIRSHEDGFRLRGTVESDRLTADVYTLENLRGSMTADPAGLQVEIDSARYGGGSIGASYKLADYQSPKPMSVDLRWKDVALETMLAAWNMKDNGLRGSATGDLSFAWSGDDDLLLGKGRGQTRFERGTVAFSDAKYPTPVSGHTQFDLDKGVIRFAKGSIVTALSTIDFRGTLGIEDLLADIRFDIESMDLGDLDRIGFNFARGQGKSEYELLGLRGHGSVAGRVVGPIETPAVTARVIAKDFEFGGTRLGNASVGLRYDGSGEVLTLENASFADGSACIDMTGNLFFPEQGPSPRFDLTIDAETFPIERAIAFADLDLVISGNATGRMIVRGDGARGRVEFERLTIEESAGRELHLGGSSTWAPGEDAVTLDLEIGAESYPVRSILAFLEMDPETPVTGDITGTLHIDGLKNELNGAGALTIRDGTLGGEPFERMSTDLTFNKGVVEVSNLEALLAAGVIRSEAEYRISDETFSFTASGADLDLGQIVSLGDVRDVVGGRLTFTANGSGDIDTPQLRIDAHLEDVTMQGTPVGSGVPAWATVEIRDGRTRIDSSMLGIAVITLDVTSDPRGRVAGTGSIDVPDLSTLAPLMPDQNLPLSGSMRLDLDFSGLSESLETLVVTGKMKTSDLRVVDQPVTIPEPIALALRNGILTFQPFSLVSSESTFGVEAKFQLTGTPTVDITTRGHIDASFFQLFTKDLVARGLVGLSLGIHGPLDDPRIEGTAEIVDGSVRISGFPQLINNLTTSIVLSGDQIRIDAFRATLGSGSVSAGGTVSVDGLDVTQFRIALSATDIDLRAISGVSLRGDFELLLAGTPEGSTLQGDVTIDSAVYYEDFNLGASILNQILAKKGISPQVTKSWQDRIALRIRVIAPGTLAFRNNMGDLTGGGEFTLTGTLGHPGALGRITIDEGGKFRFQDVDYRLTRGTIQLINPFSLDPSFEFAADARVEEYDITVNIEGTLERITTSITSDPPISDLSILSLLGPSTIGQQNRGSVSQLESSLSERGRSMLYGSIGSLVGSKILPFADVVRFDLQGDSGTEPTVTIEERVRRDLRVILIYNTTNNRNQEVIDWQVTPDFSLQLTRDSAVEGTYVISAADVRVRRRFGGRWDPFADSVGGSGTTAVVGTTRKTLGPSAPNASPDALFDTLGSTIRSIEFSSESELDNLRMSELSALEIGKPLSIVALRRTVARLFATGEFRDVRVEAVHDGDQVDLRVVLSVGYRLASITFDGLESFEKDARKVLRVRTGSRLSLSAIDHDADAVRSMLMQQGFLGASVDPETIFTRDANTASVIFSVTPGPRAIIRSMDIVGAVAPFSGEELLRRAKGDPGQPYLPENLRADTERIRGFLAKRGYRKALVTQTVEVDATDGSVAVHFEIALGPRVRVEVAGVRRSNVRRLLPFRGNDAFSEELVERSVAAIRNKYQEKGHFFATVDVEEQFGKESWTVVFIIDPGPGTRVTGVDFDGNVELSGSRLRKSVSVAPSGVFRRVIDRILFRPRGPTIDSLEDDLEAVEGVYALEGFTEAAINSPEIVRGKGGDFRVVFAVAEGPRTRLATVQVHGNQTVADRELPKLVLKVGDVLSPEAIATDLVNLRTFYAGRGYAESQVSTALTMSPDKREGNLTYRITEGPNVKIASLRIRGNTFTQEKVLRLTGGITEGDPLNIASVLQAQQKLYALGIFKRVDVRLGERSASGTERDVDVQVEEGKNISVTAALGYSVEDGARTLLTVSHRNLFGTGRYVGADVRFSLQTQKYFLTYREPFTLNLRIPTELTAYWIDETKNDVTFLRRGTYVESSKILGKRTRGAIRYEYRIANCVDGVLCDSEFPIPGIPQQDQESEVSSISPSFFLDTRDDRVNPRNGVFLSTSVEWAFPIYSAKAEFLKAFGQTTWILPGRLGTRFVFSTRFGAIHSLAPGGAAEIPVPERFFGGGENSHRAFALDELGVEGDTIFCVVDRNDDPTVVPCARGTDLVAIGGGAMAIANAELRFPVLGALAGAFFVDAGNIWSEFNTIDLGTVRYGIGAGIRYETPVGPLRLDAGFKLDRKAWEDPYALFLTIGFPF